MKSLHEIENGSVLRSSRNVVGGIIDSNSRIYIVSSESNTIKVSCFTFNPASSSISPTYYRSYGSASVPFIGVVTVFDWTSDFIYVGGSVDDRPAMTKIAMSTGATASS